MTPQVAKLMYLVVAILAVILVTGICFSRRHVWTTWAKIASVLACVTALGWSFLGFVLLHLRDYGLTGYIRDNLLGIKGTLGGITMGVGIIIAIARPYRKVDVARTQT